MWAWMLCFSLSSTIVRKAGHLPARRWVFWRMVITSVVWWMILWVAEHRIVRRAELRRAISRYRVRPQHHDVLHRCHPHDHRQRRVHRCADPVDRGARRRDPVQGADQPPRALFGLGSLTGPMLVLFNGPPNGEASWAGNVYIVMPMGLWATYLLTSRRLRTTEMTVEAIMAMMPIATIAILPIALVIGTSHRRHARPVDVHHRSGGDDRASCPGSSCSPSTRCRSGRSASSRWRNRRSRSAGVPLRPDPPADPDRRHGARDHRSDRGRHLLAPLTTIDASRPLAHYGFARPPARRRSRTWSGGCWPETATTSPAVTV